MRVLVTGGVRSGKSAHAEGLLTGRPAVTYVAAGPVPSTDDPDWAARVEAHRVRRPAHWSTVESTDLPSVLAIDQPLLVDCLGTWLTAQLDDLGWIDDDLGERIDLLVEAATACTDLVVVTNEVGYGVIPEHPSGRLFRDQLGIVNQRVAALCDEVHLVVAGRVLRL